MQMLHWVDLPYLLSLISICLCLCRHQLYTEYKAQRASMPEDIKTAGPRVKELLQVRVHRKYCITT